MKSNVLVIEDEKAHFEAIERRLKDSGFEVERLESLNKEKLYNYKALHQDSNIIVVDLNLNQSAQFSFDEGLRLVRDELWPVDRTTVFIIFSQIKPDSHRGVPPTLEPHWCYVGKKLDETDGVLHSDCLDELVSVVEEAYRVTPAFLESPRYEVVSMIREYDNFREHSRSLNPGVGPRMSIIQSMDLLDRLSRDTQSYSRAGALVEHVALAVFGSCGRLELREGSDVELCAYYSSDKEGLSKALAVMLWNRAAKLVHSRGRNFEGMKLVQQNEDGLLHVDQVDEDLPNRFVPVMSIKRILEANVRSAPHIRNRHLQILTEARPIFNPALVHTLKNELVGTTGPDTNWDTIGSLFWQDLFTQFFTDLRPEKLSEQKDYKNMVLRIFNLMILRFEFARHLCLPWDRNRFLEDIANPGILKLARFSNWWRQGSCSTVVSDELDGIIQNYIAIWDRIDARGKLGEDLRKLGSTICDCLEQLKDQPEMNHIRNSSCEWIWSTAEMRRLLEQL